MFPTDARTAARPGFGPHRVGHAPLTRLAPRPQWVLAMFLMSTALKGLASMTGYRDLGITQETGWFQSCNAFAFWAILVFA